MEEAVNEAMKDIGEMGKGDLRDKMTKVWLEKMFTLGVVRGMEKSRNIYNPK